MGTVAGRGGAWALALMLTWVAAAAGDSTEVTLGEAAELIACPLPPVGRVPVDTAGPCFAFWGNLPGAEPEYEPDPALKHPPLPVPADEAAGRWPVDPGEPLFLVRAGRIVAAGQVGDVHRGWWQRAGSDRVAYFKPTGLPDSVTIVMPAEAGFSPKRNDPTYDLYVVGCSRMAIVSPDTAPVPADFDLRAAICGLGVRRVFRANDFPKLCPPDEKGRSKLPTSAILADHLAETGAFSLLEVAGSHGRRFTILRCAPTPHGTSGAFCVLYGPDGTGMWRYMVYRLDEDDGLQLICADGFWST